MRLGIRSRLFLVALSLVVISVTAAYGYLHSRLARSVRTELQEELTARCRLAATRVAIESDIAASDIAAWDRIADELGSISDARVTIIARDGAVLGDSEVTPEHIPALENHAGRPEVTAALAGQTAVGERQSTTTHIGTSYVAVPVPGGGSAAAVLRLARPLRELDEALAGLQQLLLGAGGLALAVAILVSTLAAELASRRLRMLTVAARNMAEGELGVRAQIRGNDEFGQLGRALDRMARSLSTVMGELRSERDRLGGILSGMQEGVLVLGRDGRIALVNPALREMLLLGSDAVGRSPIEVVRNAELKELLDHVRTTQETVSREIEIGALKPRRALVRVAPLFAEKGSVFAVFVDVTEMRRLETMRRDFVANVSHELRTPVTAIRSAAETLTTALEADPKVAQSFVDIIDRNAERLQNLVEDLLDLSRIESRELRLRLEELPLDEVVEQVVTLFRERAAKKSMELVIAVPEELPYAWADRRALENVLTNLVDNAVKYGKAGGSVSITARKSGAKLEIDVADTGIGIDAEHLPRIFERFYRVDKGRSRAVGGTGLGLSIVKHLVEAMGGRVHVQSSPGQGSCFGFTLPTVPA